MQKTICVTKKIEFLSKFKFCIHCFVAMSYTLSSKGVFLIASLFLRSQIETIVQFAWVTFQLAFKMTTLT